MNQLSFEGMFCIQKSYEFRGIRLNSGGVDFYPPPPPNILPADHNFRKLTF